MRIWTDAATPALDTGNTAWVMVSAALVLLMTPGLAFFYGGMVRAKSVLNMLMMNVICMAVVGVLWVAYGYSTVFGGARAGGVIGWDASLLGLGSADSLLTSVNPSGVPIVVAAAFQMMFAIIAPALMSGAIADRTRFWGWTVFVALWVTVVYLPVANWVFGSGWILNKLHAEDFAGGTAIHINAGAGALALALVLGKRHGWRRDPMKPHNVPLVLLGASLLWFGWYGFNAGSAGAANGTAGLSFATTTAATCAAVFGWLVVEQLRDGKPTTVGAASGAVAGLVAITPGCAFVSPWGAIAIGVVAGVLCASAVGLKYRLGFDDSLDVVGVHLVGGLAGTLLIGVFGFGGDSGGQAGLLYGGGFGLLGKQAVAAVVVMAYSFVVTLALAAALRRVQGLRVSRDAELGGIDEHEHAETAYSLTGALGARFAGGSPVSAGSWPAPGPRPTPEPRHEPETRHVREDA
jgi:Amt family ammonium transporter